MNDTMQYKGYTACVHFDADDEIFWGEVVGIRDSITFHADNVAQLKKEFATSIDFYLQDCAEDGVEPNKPASGNIGARINPIVHGAGLAAAEREGKPFNQWLEALIVEKTGVALV